MFGGSSIPAFGQPATFGQNTNTVNRNPFALPGSVSGTVAHTGNPFAGSSHAGNSTDFLQPTTSNTFGSGSIFGQGSHSNNGNPFSLGGGNFGSPSPLNTSSAGASGVSMFSGNSTGVFGGNPGFGTTAVSPNVAGNPVGSGSIFGQGSVTNKGNPFSLVGGSFGTPSPFNRSTASGASMFTGTSTGVFGVNSGLGTTAFATNVGSNPVGAGTMFGQRNETNKGNPFSFGGTFGTSSSFNTSNVSGAGMLPGNSTSVFGGNTGLGTTAFATSSGCNSVPSGSIFGQRNATNKGNVFTFGGTFGTSSNFDTSSAGGFGMLPGNQRGVFGGNTGLGTTAFAPNVASNPVRSGSMFGQSNETNKGNPFSFGGTFCTSSTFNTSSSGSGMLSGNSTSMFGGNNGLGTTAFAPSVPSSFPAFGTNSSLFTGTIGSRVGDGTMETGTSKSTIISPFAPERSTSGAFGIGAGPKGSGPTKYAPTKSEVLPGNEGKLISISAMPTYHNKSHEELRFAEYQLSVDKGLKVTPAVEIPHNEPQTSSAPSAFTFPVKPNVTTTGTGLLGQFPLFKPPLLAPGNEPQTSSAPSTFTFQVQPLPNVTPLGTGLWGQINTSVAVPLTKPEPIVPPQSTISPLSDAIMNKVELPPSAGTLTHNESTGMLHPFGEKSTFRKSADSMISSASVQRGISSIKISENPTPVKRVSKLTARNLTLGRIRLSFGKYKPNSDGQKVPFFEENLSGMCKAASSLNPRQNPKTWVLKPMEEGALETKPSKSTWMESESEKGNSNESDIGKHGPSSSANCRHNITEAWVAYTEDGEDAKRNQTNEVLTPNTSAVGVDAMVPKVHSKEYYAIPSIEELTAKERVEPGFCCRVKEFVVGRKGYGSIKFLGETDVSNLDLESLIKFNNREVIVYTDEGKKPQVGKGLNKPAEISLLNIKCIDKDTGKQYVDGPKVDKYRKMLMKKAAEQEAEFVSYDPVKGEWKFRVQHF